MNGAKEAKTSLENKARIIEVRKKLDFVKLIHFILFQLNKTKNTLVLMLISCSLLLKKSSYKLNTHYLFTCDSVIFLITSMKNIFEKDLNCIHQS